MATKSVVFLRSPYNYDMDDVSLETGLACEDESLAVQSAAEESDINTIVRRFGLTGELPGDVDMPQSGDYSGVGDFHSAMNVVRQAQEEFLRVPADIRARFLMILRSFRISSMILRIRMKLFVWVLLLASPFLLPWSLC